MKNENDVKAKIKKVFKRYGVWNTAISQTGYSQPGVPDYLSCVGGRLLAVEAKFGSNAPTALQKEQMRQIKESGGLTMVVNEQNLGEFESQLYTWLERFRSE